MLGEGPIKGCGVNCSGVCWTSPSVCSTQRHSSFAWFQCPPECRVLVWGEEARERVAQQAQHNTAQHSTSTSTRGKPKITRIPPECRVLVWGQEARERVAQGCKQRANGGVRLVPGAHGHFFEGILARLNRER